MDKSSQVVVIEGALVREWHIWIFGNVSLIRFVFVVFEDLPDQRLIDVGMCLDESIEVSEGPPTHYVQTTGARWARQLDDAEQRCFIQITLLLLADPPCFDARFQKSPWICPPRLMHLHAYAT